MNHLKVYFTISLAVDSEITLTTSIRSIPRIRVLPPAMLETDQTWAADIRRTRHIGDFSRWQEHDAYQQAFERLLRDLKVGDEAAAETALSEEGKNADAWN